jgi:hypothetical protein
MARTPDVMVFSRKLRNNGLYKGNETFAKEVLRTANIARSKEDHIELLKNRFPNYIIVPLWTYEHSSFCLELSPSCQFDSSADAFAAYKNKNKFDKEFKKINEEILDDY